MNTCWRTLDRNFDRVSSFSANHFGGKLPWKWMVAYVDGKVLNNRGRHGHNGLRCSSISILYQKFHVKVVTRFGNKYEVAWASSQYVSKPIHQNMLTSS